MGGGKENHPKQHHTAIQKGRRLGHQWQRGVVWAHWISGQILAPLPIAEKLRQTNNQWSRGTDACTLARKNEFRQLVQSTIVNVLTYSLFVLNNMTFFFSFSYVFGMLSKGMVRSCLLSKDALLAPNIDGVMAL